MGGVLAGARAEGKATTVALDLDGVIYLDGVLIPGAGDALRELQAEGYRLLYVTNNSTVTPDSVVHRIERLSGFAADPAAVASSSLATARYLRGTITTAFVLGGDGIRHALASVGIEEVDEWQEAEAVVVGLDPGLSYPRLAAASLAVRRGARFIASNDDATYPTPEGLKPGAGAVVAAVQTATGVVPEVCGKPHPPIRALVREMAGGGDIIVVGDRLDTDIAMAVTEGWGSVLVLSGVTRPDDAIPGDLTPDLVLDSLAGLPAALREGRLGTAGAVQA